jgi:plastocyanin
MAPERRIYCTMRRLLFLTACAFGLLACSDDNGGPSDNNGPEGDIVVDDNFFDPATFNATAGTPVVWSWVGELQHNVTFADQAPGSSTQTSGTFQRTFTAAGAYSYFCTIHGPQAMSGVVNVAAAGGAEGGGGGGSGGGGGGSGGGGSGGGGAY